MLFFQTKKNEGGDGNANIKKGKLTLKKIVGKVHLWLGLTSGLLVVLLGITGCILAFEIEIRNATESYRFVAPQNKGFLPPSALKITAERELSGQPINILEYSRKNDAALAFYYNDTAYKQVFINPYTAQVQHVKDMNSDFFGIVLNGHFYLWLPPAIGKPIVASATLIFLIMMISGLVLWWPRNKAGAKQRFRFKWMPGTKWKRKNYDLHNVMGFYMTWVAIFLAITGLVFGFEWFAKTVYWATSGGKSLPAHTDPVSDTLMAAHAKSNLVDEVWYELMKLKQEDEKAGIYFPENKTAPLEGFINHRRGTYYNSDTYHYDQYTGRELPAEGVYAGSFKNASVADKLARMNYDIHVGAVLGLPGKILAFFASLVAASLPITGFIIWRGRRKKYLKPLANAASV